MKLLIFAHRGEAQTFLKEEKARVCESGVLGPPLQGLFQCSLGHILITGEGPHRALGKTCTVLAALSARGQRVEQVWNLGIAGALRPEISLGDIYPLRTIYALASHAPHSQVEFHSYTSHWPHARSDCVSSPVRILDSAAADHADNFAPLVDGEAWGVARACQSFEIPFFPVKLASDRPTLANPDACQSGRAGAATWSDQLYRWFREHSPTGPQTRPQETRRPLGPEEWPNLYFTVSGMRQLRHLTAALLSRGATAQEIEALAQRKEVQGEGLTPKQKGAQFLKLLRQQLNPVQTEVRHQLEECVEPLRRAGFQIGLDADLEREQFSLRAQVKDGDHLQRLQSGLAQFSFSRFARLMRGEVDV